MSENNIKIPTELLKKYCKDKHMDQKQYHKEYYIKNKEKLKEQSIEWQKNNPHKLNEYRKKYNESDGGKKKSKEYSKKYHEEHKEKEKEYDKQKNIENREKNKELRKANKEKNDVYFKEYRQRKEVKEKSTIYQREYARKRIAEDIEYRVKRSLRSRLRAAVTKKVGRTMELVGCSIPDLIKHLENQFTEGMSWENYGKWHIDHIRPCASFNLLNEEEQRVCFHYSNLQPLWAIDNLKKKDKWIND